MSQLATDISQFRSVLDFIVEFLNSRERLKDLKIRQNKHLIGTVFPSNVELVCAAGAYPVNAIRMEKIGNPTIVHALDLGKSLLGDAGLTQLIRVFRQYDQSKLVDTLVSDLLEAINTEYNRLVDIGISLGINNDACFGIKFLAGALSEKGKNLDAFFCQSIRCSPWEKTYESCAKYTKGIWLDVPPYDDEASHQLAVANVRDVTEQLEKITGQTITNNSLVKIVQITNECKDYSKKLIDLALRDFSPLHPKTFSELLALIEICFQDYLSNPALFRDLLKKMYFELEPYSRESKYKYNVQKIPKLLFTPRFGGWDSIVEDYTCAAGGRLIYNEWFLYGHMNPISTAGDMIDNIASNFQSCGVDFGADNHRQVNRILDFVRSNKMDGVVYNQLFGCHSLSTGYSRLRSALIKDEIPSTMITFSKLGENREQLKTRIDAFMELLRK